MINILIVEGKKIVAEHLERRLKEIEYTVCAVVPTGAEAVQKAAEMQPDIVLINIELEGEIDGIETAKQIRDSLDIPTIYLADYPNDVFMEKKDLLKRAEITNPFQYIPQPHGKRRLYLTIESSVYQHKKEREIKIKEQQLSTILNSINDAVIATDDKELITFMNPAAERLTGWRLEQAASLSIKQIFRIDNEGGCPITAILRNMLAASTADSPELSTDTVIKDSTVFTSRSGRKTHIDYSIAPATNQKGEIAGTVITFRDITDYKAMEERLNQTINQLQDQTQLMGTIFDSMSDGVMAVDTDGQYLMVNTRAQEMIAPLSEDVSIVDRPERYGLFQSDGKTLFAGDELPLTRALHGETTNNIEMLVSNDTHAEEIFVNINGRPLLDGQGNLKGGVVVFRDTTELKAAQTELEKTVSELRSKTQLMDTVFNSISDGVVVTDEAGNFLLVNPSAARIVGMGPTDTPPDQWSETYGTFYPDKMTPFPNEELPLIQAMQGRVTDEVDLFIRNPENPDGCFINVTGRPLQDEQNKVRGGVIVFRDVTKTKNTEARLEQTVSELEDQTQLMDIIFNNMSDGVVVADENGKYIMANPAAEQMNGRSFNELDLTRASEQYGVFDPATGSLFPPDQLPLTRAVKGESTDNVEMHVRNEQLSQEIYLSVNGRPLLDEKGVPRGGVVVAHNITELKQTQIQLEQTVTELENQTQLLEVVFNNMSDGVVVADDKGQYVMYNQTAEQMTGQQLEPMAIKDAPKHFGFFFPDKKTTFPADQLPLARALHGQESDNVNIFMHNTKMQEGLHLSVSARPLRDSQGVVTGGVSVSRDVTKLRQAEIELKSMVSQLEEQGNLMESIFNSISDGVVVADENGAFTIFNPSAEKIIGLGAVDTTPDHWSDDYGLFFPDRVTPFPTDELPLTLALKGEASDEVEMFVRNPKVPSGVFISASGRPLYDEAGTDKGGVVVFRDVTHRVIAEEALTQAFAQGRLEIVETILHNIGNAINSVTIGINVLQENIVGNQLIHRFSALADMVKARQADWVDFIKDDPKGQQVLPFMIALATDFADQNKKMVETLERVGERVTHIIDIIRTQRSSNQSSMTRKNIDLHEAILGAVKLQQDSIHKRGIQVDVESENAPQEIQIQESQFQQMLVNLLKNSIEAIDERMQSGGLNETPRIQIKAYINEDFLHLDVTDNGIGIAQKDLKLIFTAGYTTKEAGTGLGLHASANFVIGSGGKIYPLSDGLGKGTTMRIMMRCCQRLSEQKDRVKK